MKDTLKKFTAARESLLTERKQIESRIAEIDSALSGNTATVAEPVKKKRKYTKKVTKSVDEPKAKRKYTKKIATAIPAKSKVPAKAKVPAKPKAKIPAKSAPHVAEPVAEPTPEPAAEPVAA